MRKNVTVREMVRETRLSTKDLISPMFVDENITRPREIQSMPGIYNLPIDSVVKEGNEASELGVPAVLLFGIPKLKDEEGSEAWSSAGMVQTSDPGDQEGIQGGGHRRSLPLRVHIAWPLRRREGRVSDER